MKTIKNGGGKKGSVPPGTGVNKERTARSEARAVTMTTGNAWAGRIGGGNRCYALAGSRAQNTIMRHQARSPVAACDPPLPSPSSPACEIL